MSQLEVVNICSSAGREIQAAVPCRETHLDAIAGFELRSAEWDEAVYRVGLMPQLIGGPCVHLHITSGRTSPS